MLYANNGVAFPSLSSCLILVFCGNWKNQRAKETQLISLQIYFAQMHEYVEYLIIWYG